MMVYNQADMPNANTALPSSRHQLLLSGALLALIVADGVITRYIVTSGLGREGNPFLKSWVTNSDFLLVKLASALLVVLILWDLHKKNSRIVLIITSVFVGVYCLIVWWNVLVTLLGAMQL